jgi:hypothetical protein
VSDRHALINEVARLHLGVPKPDWETGLCIALLCGYRRTPEPGQSVEARPGYRSGASAAKMDYEGNLVYAATSAQEGGRIEILAAETDA